MTLKQLYSYRQFFNQSALPKIIHEEKQTCPTTFTRNWLIQTLLEKHIWTPYENFDSNFFRVFKFILTAYYYHFFYSVLTFFIILQGKKRCNQQQSPEHQFWTDGPEVVKIRVLSLQVVYSWPSLYLSLYTVIGLEATQVYHMITNHNSVRLLYTLQGVDKNKERCKIM